MSRIERCANPLCGHDKSAHYKARDLTREESTRIVGSPYRSVYFNCLSSFCECKSYVPEAQKKSA